MAAAFIPLAATAVGTAIRYPFEMDTIVALCGRRRVATHYGLYSSITGLGIVAGNTGVGALLTRGSPWPWLVMLTIGACATAAVHNLGRAGRLAATDEAPAQVAPKVAV